MSVALAKADSNQGHRSFRFEPLPASTACVPGGVGTAPNEQPFLLPQGFVQAVFAREGDGGAPDNFDMNTLNETGRRAGRFLYRTHETPTNGAVSVTDLRTGLTRVLAQREDWNRLDGIVWTPWRTLLIAEEMRPGATAVTSGSGGSRRRSPASSLKWIRRPGRRSRVRPWVRRRTKAYASTGMETFTASPRPRPRRSSARRLGQTWWVHLQVHAGSSR